MAMQNPVSTTDETHNTHNYFAHGGNELVIGGKLTILPTAELDDSECILSPCAGGAVAEYQDASTATTISALKDDFNALLTKLKSAGLMESSPNIVM